MRGAIPTALLLALSLRAPEALGQQVCGEPHYRWSEKIDTSFRADSATDVDVTDIQGWTGRKLGRKDKCAPRARREKRLYRLTGWVRVIHKNEEDQDWHIELTQEENAPLPQCVIVEIPSPTVDSIYQAPRDQLVQLTKASHVASGDVLTPPVRLTFTGPAFFDGIHSVPGGDSRCMERIGRERHFFGPPGFDPDASVPPDEEAGAAAPAQRAEHAGRLVR